MIFSKDLPIDPENPLSCVYWLYDTRKHTDPRKEGYVGVCKYGMVSRLRNHNRAAKNGSKLPVHRAIRKYGEFLGVVVLILADPEFCLLAENLLRPVPNMPGTLNVAMGGVISPTTGTQHSAETRAKISKANKGKPGTAHTPEHLAKMSERFSGDRNPMFGITPDEDTKDKISRNHMDMFGRTKSMDSYRQLVESDANTIRGYAAWRAPNANKDVWLRAEEIYNLYKSKGSCGQKRLCTLLNDQYIPSALATISKKLRTDWNPSEDSVYQEWKREYSKQKDTGRMPPAFKVLPWENSSATTKTRHVWALAQEMCEIVIADPGIGASRLGRNFGLTEASCAHITRKLKSGWVPNEDQHWLEFSKKQKELHESTCTA